MAQVDTELGAVERNLARMQQIVDDAATQGADLVVFPELSTSGYMLGQTPRDSSIETTDPCLARLAAGGVDVLAGFHEDAKTRAYNSAAYLSGGAVVHVQRKLYLPTYLAWEERKHSSPGQALRAFDTRFGRTAVLICNDAWQSALPWLAVQDGAELLLVPANSATNMNPSVDTIRYWQGLLTHMARMLQCWVVFVNRVGDEAGARFWGGSRVVDPTGDVIAQAPLWEPALVIAELDVAVVRRHRRELPLLAEARLSLVARELDRLIADGGDA